MIEQGNTKEIKYYESPRTVKTMQKDKGREFNYLSSLFQWDYEYGKTIVDKDYIFVDQSLNVYCNVAPFKETAVLLQNDSWNWD